MVNFSKCTKSLQNGKAIELKSQLTIREWYSINQLDTPGKIVIKKQRSSFMHAGNFFNLDTSEIGGLTFSVLIIQGHKDRKTVEIPEIIKQNIIAEISS